MTGHVSRKCGFSLLAGVWWPRGTSKTLGGIAGAKEKVEILRPCKGEGLADSLASPGRSQGERRNVRFAADTPGSCLGRAWGLGWLQGSLGRLRGGSGVPGKAQGEPRSHAKVTGHVSRKCGFSLLAGVWWPRGASKTLGGLAGAKEKVEIPGHPKEKGWQIPWPALGSTRASDEISELVTVGLGRAWGLG